MIEGPPSEFVKHVPCASCGSSDANSLYTDGHTYCFGCQALTAGDGSTASNSRRPRLAADMLTGEVRAITARGLSEATCAKFGYRVGKARDGRTVQIAEYRDEEGAVVAQKVRDSTKEFAVIGDGKRMPLFGQHLWQAGGRRIVVTEGEIDAMSVAQVFNLTWPAVSVPNGAQAAKKSLQRALEFLESFESVVLAFDMDEEGRKAAAECALLFTPGKCCIAEYPLKDANAMLVAGKLKELTTSIYQARVYRPDGIVTLSEIKERVLASPDMGRPWFLPAFNKATFGRRLGEIVAVGAGTGVGKTDFLTQQIAYDVMTLKVPVGALFLEQGVGETGRRIAGKLAGKRFHIPDGSWDQKELEETWEGLERSERLHLYDSWGANDWETIQSKIRFMVCSLGCEHVYLDHLTALAAAADDERKALEGIMASLAGMANGLRFHLTLVSHLATPEGKPHEEGGRVMIRHFKGSRAIGFWSHFMVGLERNQQADDPKERSVTTLRGLKDRFTGKSTGQTFGIGYDDKTGLLSEVDLHGFDGGSDGGGADF